MQAVPIEHWKFSKLVNEHKAGRLQTTQRDCRSRQVRYTVCLPKPYHEHPQDVFLNMRAPTSRPEWTPTGGAKTLANTTLSMSSQY